MAKVTFKEINRLAVPAIIAGIAEPLISITDIAIIGNVKDLVRKFMDKSEEGQVEYAIMVVSELMENAIKYGTTNDKQQANVRLDFSISPENIGISVKNAIEQDQGVTNFLQIIDNIIASDDKEQLYLQRMQEIFDNPDMPGSQLGLYRIASEAQYDLSYSIENDILKINARKELVNIA